MSLDTQIFDLIAADEAAIDLVRRLTDYGELELVVTHVQEEEIADIADEAKRARIAEIPRSVVATNGFVPDTSRLDMARLSDLDAIASIRKSNWPKYTRDALIAATALSEGLVLVTEDRTLASRAERELSLQVWGWPRLRRELEARDRRQV